MKTPARSSVKRQRVKDSSGSENPEDHWEKTSYLYMWGANEFGELGLGTGDADWDGSDGIGTVCKPAQVWKHKGITDVFGGSLFTAAIAQGEVYTWGVNDDGALGRITDSSGISEETIAKVEVYDEEKNKQQVKFKSLAFGCAHTAAISHENQLYLWGCYKNSFDNQGFMTKDSSKIHTPRIFTLPQPNLQIVHIASASNHTIAVTKGGRVWEWGLLYDFLHHQNGVRESSRLKTRQAMEPRLIELPANVNAYAAAAGEQHVFVQTDLGVYCWGLNRDGQLGVGTTTDLWKPKRTPNLENVKSICAGAFFTMMLDNDGNVFSFGRNSDGQCGLPIEPVISTPRKIDIDGILSISTGAVHGMALSKQGYIYTWGLNSSGQLGNGSVDPGGVQHQPRKIVFGEHPQNAGIVKISCGHHFCAVLLRDGAIGPSTPAPKDCDEVYPEPERKEEESESKEEKEKPTGFVFVPTKAMAPVEGGWTCACCEKVNTADAKTCADCWVARPAAGSVPAAAVAVPPAQGKFTFGVPAPTPAGSAPVFNFGAPNANQPFAFGTGQPTFGTAQPTFTFGTQAATPGTQAAAPGTQGAAKPTGFTFGTPATPAAPAGEWK